MVDLEFDRLAEAEAFLATMQQLGNGPGKAVMHRARIADVCEVTDI